MEVARAEASGQADRQTGDPARDQVGDPLVRMGRTTEVGIDSGLDRRQAQPGWAAAIGLSLGPTADSQVAGTIEGK